MKLLYATLAVIGFYAPLVLGAADPLSCKYRLTKEKSGEVLREEALPSNTPFNHEDIIIFDPSVRKTGTNFNFDGFAYHDRIEPEKGPTFNTNDWSNAEFIFKTETTIRKIIATYRPITKKLGFVQLEISCSNEDVLGQEQGTGSLFPNGLKCSHEEFYRNERTLSLDNLLFARPSQPSNYLIYSSYSTGIFQAPKEENHLLPTDDSPWLEMDRILLAREGAFLDPLGGHIHARGFQVGIEEKYIEEPFEPTKIQPVLTVSLIPQVFDTNDLSMLSARHASYTGWSPKHKGWHPSFFSRCTVW